MSAISAIGAASNPLLSSGVGATEMPEATSATSPTAGTGTASGTASIGDDSFANVLGNAIDSVQGAQSNADDMATQAATGSLTNVSDYMVAAEEANLDTSLTVAVRNNALQAFQQIMGMAL
jgi:flagellar hook-basal body complex protein FliE